MKKLNLKNFIIKSNLIHKNVYDYSLVDYNDCKTKIKIICNKHGIFEQTPDDHLHGHGCSICGTLKGTEKRSKSLNKFIIGANIIHKNKYDYTISQYNTARKKIKIICYKHGIFEQTPDNHLAGKGCPICRTDNIRNLLTKTIDKFIVDANIIHDNKYDYSLVEYKNATIKIKIICNKHGIFEQTPNNHLRNHGCPICQSSKGEININKFLKQNNIVFEREKKFDDCKGKKRMLSFDFYLPIENILIEYDGKQHYMPVNFYGCSDEQAQKIYFDSKQNDEIKDKYCDENNIQLIRISYKEKNIENILKNNLIQ